MYSTSATDYHLNYPDASGSNQRLPLLFCCIAVLIFSIFYYDNDLANHLVDSRAPIRRLLKDHEIFHSDTDSSSFHPNDRAFGIARDQPLPTYLVRRLADMESSGPRKSLQSASLYGGIYDYAYYFVSILVGTPPQRESVIVDSGSSLLGFPCYNCRECGRSHMDEGFDFTKSSTAHWLSCHDPQCIAGRCGLGDVCPYQQSYSEGSSIEGNYFSDFVALGEQERNNSFVRFDYIGCHNRETKLFVSQKASGILGVSYPKNNKQETLIDALFKSPDIDTKIFGICASEEGGLMTIGGYNSSLHQPSRTKGSSVLRMLGLSQSLRFDMKMRERMLNGVSFNGYLKDEPLSRLRHLLEEYQRRILLDTGNSNNALGDDGSNKDQIVDRNVIHQPNIVDHASVSVAWTHVTSSTTYQIDVLEMTALEEAGSTIKIDDNIGMTIATNADLGSCIVDSGTTFSYLAPRAFQAFMNILDKSCTTKTSHFCDSRATTNSDGLCWKIESKPMFDLLPSFLLKLHGGAIVEWKAHSYLHRRAKTNIWCVAVDDNRQSTSILGMSFMKQKNVIFDRERNLLGFVEANCPTVSDTSRPPPPTFPPPTVTPVHVDSYTIPISNDKAPAVASVDFKFEKPNISMSKSEEVVDSSMLLSDNTWLLWASVGLLMGIGVLAMGAITIKSIRGRSQDYQPMEGDRSTGLTRVGGDDLELAMYREEDDDQTSLASQRGRTNRDYQLGYTDEEIEIH